MSASPDFNKVQQSLRDKNICVLIWGPGEGQPEYDKREKIRDHIRANLTSQAYFSEELTGKIPRAQYRTPQKQQFWHLEWCDICIVLDTSLTTANEVMYFNLAFGDKFFVLIHETSPHLQIYSAGFREGLDQHVCDDEDWQIDKLAERALARAEDVAMGKIAGVPV
jgi:hypothetical protein